MKLDCRVLFLAGIFGHALMLINPHNYWDGALYQALRQDGDWAGVVLPFRDAGYPIQGLFHWVVGYIPEPATIYLYRAFAFLFLWGASVALHRILAEHAGLSRQASLAAAALSLVSPIWFIAVSTVSVPTIGSYCAFAWAVLFTLRSRWGVAVVFFLLAFTWRSFLVQYALILAIFALTRRWRHMALATLLPLSYWFINRALFPQRGQYASENLFVGWQEALRSAGHFGSESLPALLGEMVHGLFSVWTLLGSVALTLLMSRRCVEQSRVSTRRQALFGASLALVLAIIPYAAVGKFPAAQGWTARWALLVVMPLSVLIIVVLDRLVDFWPWRGSEHMRTALFILVVTASGASLVEHDWDWLQRGRKDAAIVRALRTLSAPIEQGKSVCVSDNDRQYGHGEPYRSYEWSAMFRQAWGGPARSWWADDFSDGYSPLGLRTLGAYRLVHDRRDHAGCDVWIEVSRNVSGINVQVRSLR